jgi:hypothetical protein
MNEVEEVVQAFDAATMNRVPASRRRPMRSVAQCSQTAQFRPTAWMHTRARHRMRVSRCPRPPQRRYSQNSSVRPDIRTEG